MTHIFNKLSLYNIFKKWPKIILFRCKEKIRHTIFSGLIFRNNPVVLEDNFQIRFLLYPWDGNPLEKLISRRVYKEEFEIYKKIIKDGDIVFDIGANIGILSAFFSKLAGSHGHIYSFEPVSESYFLLKETLALNRCENVLAYNMAVGNIQGKMKMNIFDRKYSEWNTFGKPKFGKIEPVMVNEVNIDTVDNFCAKNNIKHIDLLKIDVEGFEKTVFEGAKNMLRNGFVDIVAFEISRIPLMGAGFTTNDIFDSIYSFDYKVYEFDSKSGKFLGPITDSDKEYQNYFASKEDLTLK